MKNKGYEFILLVVTAFWGLSFLLTKDVLGELSLFNFLALRFGIAFIFSSIVFFKSMCEIDKATIKYGISIGVILFLSFVFQTLGISYISASKVAFITGLSVVIVPMISAIILKRKLSISVWIGAIFAIVGLGLMTLEGETWNISVGEIYALLGAIFFALYVVLVEIYTKKVNSVNFAILQLAIVSLFSFAISILTESVRLPHKSASWVGLLVLALLCTSGAYIAQNVLQNYVSASKTAIIFSTEPVFAGIFGMLIWKEILTTNAILGGALIFIGMLVVEVGSDIYLKFSKNSSNQLS